MCGQGRAADAWERHSDDVDIGYRLFCEAQSNDIGIGGRGGWHWLLLFSDETARRLEFLVYTNGQS